MTSREIYKKFLLKANENDRNSNIRIGKGEFVLIFNEQLLFWFSDLIQINKSNSQKNEINNFLVFDKELVLKEKLKLFDLFKLPDNFFDIESSFSVANKNGCIRKLYNHDLKARNRNIIEQDINNNPSFDFEETNINLSENNLIVFKEDFEIEQQYLTYYKKPILIDLEGYNKIDGTPSKNIDTDLDDIHINSILNRCIVEISGNYKDVESAQLSNLKTKI